MREVCPVLPVSPGKGAGGNLADLREAMNDALYYIGGLVRGYVVAIGTFILGALSHYWHNSPETLRNALIGAAFCVVADTILGVVSCFACPAEHRFSSHAFARVFTKLTVYGATMMAAYGVDTVSSGVVGATVMFQLTVAVLIAFREVSSLLEHSAVLGVPWPESLVKKLDVMRKKAECLGEDPPPRPRRNRKGGPEDEHH